MDDRRGVVLGLVVALLAFAAATVLSATAFGLVGGAITRAVAVASLGVGLGAAAWTMRVGRGVILGRATEGGADAPAGSTLIRLLDVSALIAFAAATLRQFLWLGVSDGVSVTQLNPYNYGDLPLHWTYVSVLAEGVRFWPHNPVFTGVRLGYPIGADLLAALFVTLGAPVALVFRLSGVLASAALYVALRRWAGPLGVAAFVFSGGIAFSRFSGGELLRANDTDIAWLNVLLALFVPQRGFLYAFPAGLVLLWSARETLLRDRPGLPAAVFGLLWGAMPLFHVHTFLVVSLVVATWAIGTGRVRSVVPSLLVALPLGTFSAYQVTEGFQAARLVWWLPGWMISGDPLVFLLVNFGILVHLAWLAVLWPPRAAKREARFILVTAFVMFGTLFFVMLAPWVWDNTKAMVWCILLMLGPLPAWLAERRPWLRGLLVVLVLLPGVPSAIGGFLASKPLTIYEEEEKAAVCQMLRNVPVNARVATAQTFDHPVALCGRGIVAGYAGHLWSHGLRSKPVEERLQRLMRGEPGWEAAARDLHAEFVFWGPREGQEYPGPRAPWRTDPRRVAAGSAGSLYRLSD